MQKAKLVRHLRARRRSIALIGALVLAAGIATPSLGAAQAGATTKSAAVIHNTCSRSAIDVPSCGVLWGMFSPPQNYGTWETKVGRQFDVVKNYMGWKPGEIFPDEAAQSLAGNGQRILYFSWNATNYTTRAKITYQSIADGSWDQSVIIPEAKALIAFHQKVFIDFQHEFDSKSQSGRGTPAQYVAAYQHIHQVFAAQGVTNVIWVWVSTGYMPNIATIAASYPGSAYVDWVGYDAYNYDQCHAGRWLQPLQVFQPYYLWLQSQPSMASKPIFVTEFASINGSAVQAWYAGIPSMLQQLPKIKAVMQWNSEKSSLCDYRLSSSAPALAGFKTAGLNPYITGASG